MALVEHLVAGDDVLADMADVHRRLAHRQLEVAETREVLAGDDRLHALQRFGALGVDRDDPGMGVRAAQDLAVQHPGDLVVRAVIGAAGDLVDAVRADRAGADNGELRGRDRDVHAALRSCLISEAASITARITLS
jgi:hypothetical protein